MSTEPPKKRPLTPIEKANLQRLLAQADDYEEFVKNSPTAAELRRLKAEEKRLRVEQEKLAQAEAKAEKKLFDLQCALDETTSKLEKVLRAKDGRPSNHPAASDHGLGDRNRRAGDAFPRLNSGPALKYLHAMVAGIKERLPQAVKDNPDDLSAENFDLALNIFLKAEFPHLFEETPAPSQADLDAAALAAADEQRRITSRAIVASGKKARGEKLTNADVIALDDFRKKDQ
jgi:hypothetical protein